MKFMNTTWKATRRSAAVLVALMFVAAPAGASIIVQNYMEADIVAAPPCFVKTTGDDPAGSTLSTFDATTNTIAVDGTNLLEEKITVTGMVGDRVIYTDVVHYENNCDEPINVSLTTVDASGDWTGVAAELWISNVAAPADIDPNLDAAGAASDWNDTGIIVPAGTAAGPLVLSTGVVTVPAGGEVQGAYVISTDNSVTPTVPPTTIASLNWVAQATIG